MSSLLGRFYYFKTKNMFWKYFIYVAFPEHIFPCASKCSLSGDHLSLFFSSFIFCLYSMAIQSPQPSPDPNLSGRFIRLALVLWFDIRCVSDNGFLMLRVQHNHLLYDIHSFGSESDLASSRMYPLDVELE